jgi:uncharacterized membrane protein YcjF (UPF0283 family)
MDTTSGTVSVWQSGRLAPRTAARRFEFSREQWLATALLVLSALVLTAFVAVLEKDVDGGAMQHQVQRSRAVAEARCESDQPAERRGRCIAMLDGDVAALDAPAPLAPDNTAYAAAYEQENLARATTVSLLATR